MKARFIIQYAKPASSKKPETLTLIDPDSGAEQSVKTEGYIDEIDTSTPKLKTREQLLFWLIQVRSSNEYPVGFRKLAEEAYPIVESAIKSIDILPEDAPLLPVYKITFQEYERVLLIDNIPGLPTGGDALEIGQFLSAHLHTNGMVLFGLARLVYSKEKLTHYVADGQKPGKKTKGAKTKGKAERIKPTGFFRRSAHLQDNILKYNDNKTEPIFDGLNLDTQKKIREAKVETTAVAEGIKLSGSEQKVIDSLCKLLHDRSQTEDSQKSDYYSGNQEPVLVKFGSPDPLERVIAPVMAITLYDLAKEFRGGEVVGGKELQNVKAIVQELESKKFLIRYKETTLNPDNTSKERSLEAFQSLFMVLNRKEVDFDETKTEIRKTEELVISLHPIFRHQIDTKWIKYPSDILSRTVIAYGSHNVPESVFRLRDYLVRSHSSGVYENKIGVEKLHWTLCEKWMKEGRKKKVAEFTQKAIDVALRLGILSKYEVQAAKDGSPMMVFTLAKSWS